MLIFNPKILNLHIKILIKSNTYFLRICRRHTVFSLPTLAHYSVAEIIDGATPRHVLATYCNSTSPPPPPVTSSSHEVSHA